LTDFLGGGKEEKKLCAKTQNTLFLKIRGGGCPPPPLPNEDPEKNRA